MSVLKALVNRMLDHFNDDVLEYTQDPLSTASGVHVSGTEGQSESTLGGGDSHSEMDTAKLPPSLWQSIRAMRITGSTFKEYSTNPGKVASSLWSPKPNLSRVKSIRWGTEKEPEARLAYEEKTGLSVTCCGIFVSKSLPLFGASPDGLISCPAGNILLEIKCPFSLKDNDLKIPSKVKIPFLDSNLKLRKTHQYFFQIQLGMFVTGCKSTHFVT